MNLRRPGTQTTPWGKSGTRAIAASLAAVGAILGSAGVAGAAAPTVGVEYSASSDCPRAAEFISLVGRRTRGLWQLREGEGEPRFAVEIRPEGAMRIGRIRRTSAGKPSEPRELLASDCRELVQALAFTTALSLDEPRAPAAAPVVTTAARPQSMESASSRAEWLVGVGLSALALLPPSPMAGASLMLENRDPHWPGGLALHRPDLRLTFAHARNDLIAAPEKAIFALSTLGASVCPVGWSVLRLCGAGEVGILAGRGIQVDEPRSSRSLWLALGGAVRARWALTRSLTVEAEAGLRAPLHHTDFVFDMPRLPVATVPSAIASGGLALGVSIP